MSIPIDIIPVTVSELEDLHDIAVRTFTETFADTNSPENMKLYLDSSFDRTKFKRELENPDSWFYFAKIGNEIGGYLKFNVRQAQTEIRDDAGFEVERIYILQKFYGKGIGAALMDFALVKASEKGKEYVWLGVFEKNFRAQAFYRKYGFEVFDEHVFVLGNSRQRDVLMSLEISDDSSRSR